MVDISLKLNNLIKKNIAIKLINKVNNKRELSFLLCLFILNSIFEGLTVLSIFPFLSIITSPEDFYENKIVFLISDFFGIKGGKELLLPITLIFLIFILISLTFKLISIWSTAHISANIQVILSRLLFRKNLYQSYQSYTKADSSKMITATTSYAIAGGRLIYSLLNIIAASIMSLFIVIALIIFNWKISISLIISICLIYILISLFIKKKTYVLGLHKAKAEKNSIKILQEGFGGFRDILLNASQEIFISNLTKSETISKLSIAKQNFYGFFPRNFIEAIVLITISLIAFSYSNNLNNENNFIYPILGTYALALQRLLPLAQQLYFYWNDYNFRIPSAVILLEELNDKENLEIPIMKIEKKDMNESIEFKNVFFKYDKNQNNFALKNISFKIKKGEHIGIIGSSGSGKSTLLDLIMSLLKPSSGNIFIDNFDLYSKNNPNLIFNWRKSIAHVPQNIFLTEGSIAQNIIFGKNEGDLKIPKLIKAAEKANLLEFINKTKYGFETLVGERGVQLSGGQKQRIGIARALYNECRLLILDEATNALDIKTENNILQTLNKLKGELTILTVTHKTNQNEFFDRLFEISNGSLVEKNK